MSETIYIMGHKNPDTDSICSAIAFAELKKLQGSRAVAKRLGNINRETEFVLDYFSVDRPEYLSTVKTQISDLTIDEAYPVLPGTSLKTTWDIMKKSGAKTVPIVDQDSSLLGILSVSDITDEYIDAHEKNTISSTETPLASIAETLAGEVICGSASDFATTGKIVIAATDPSEMAGYIGKGDIVITGNRSDSQAKALEAGANCLVITCGIRPEKVILETASEMGSVILLTPYETFTTVRLINLSIPAGAIMKCHDLVKFNLHDYVDDIQEKMLKTRYRSYPVVDDQNRIKGFISRYHLIARNRKKVILVDHNELAQAVNGIEQADILEIVDHHRLGDIQTIHPIYVQSEPVGSTATIIAEKYFASGHPLKPGIAGILFAAIISDTIKFRSPTCTDIDRNMAFRLAEIAGIADVDAFAARMFKEGSSLEGRSPEDIFHQDFKEYTFQKKSIGMSQIFTVDIESIGSIGEKLTTYMKSLCNQKNYNLLMLFVTDVLEEGSLVLCAGEDVGLVEKAFGIPVTEGRAFLPGIVSRKKQVIPLISVALERQG